MSRAIETWKLYTHQAQGCHKLLNMINLRNMTCCFLAWKTWANQRRLSVRFYRLNLLKSSLGAWRESQFFKNKVEMTSRDLVVRRTKRRLKGLLRHWHVWADKMASTRDLGQQLTRIRNGKPLSGELSATGRLHIHGGTPGEPEEEDHDITGDITVYTPALTLSAAFKRWRHSFTLSRAQTDLQTRALKRRAVRTWHTFSAQTTNRRAWDRYSQELARRRLLSVAFRLWEQTKDRVGFLKLREKALINVTQIRCKIQVFSSWRVIFRRNSLLNSLIQVKQKQVLTTAVNTWLTRSRDDKATEHAQKRLQMSLQKCLSTWRLVTSQSKRQKRLNKRAEHYWQDKSKSYGGRRQIYQIWREKCHETRISNLFNLKKKFQRFREGILRVKAERITRETAEQFHLVWGRKRMVEGWRKVTLRGRAAYHVNLLRLNKFYGYWRQAARDVPRADRLYQHTLERQALILWRYKANKSKRLREGEVFMTKVIRHRLVRRLFKAWKTHTRDARRSRADREAQLTHVTHTRLLKASWTQWEAMWALRRDQVTSLTLRETQYIQQIRKPRQTLLYLKIWSYLTSRSQAARGLSQHVQTQTLAAAFSSWRSTWRLARFYRRRLELTGKAWDRKILARRFLAWRVVLGRKRDGRENISAAVEHNDRDVQLRGTPAEVSLMSPKHKATTKALASRFRKAGVLLHTLSAIGVSPDKTKKDSAQVSGGQSRLSREQEEREQRQAEKDLEAELARVEDIPPNDPPNPSVVSSSSAVQTIQDVKRSTASSTPRSRLFKAPAVSKNGGTRTFRRPTRAVNLPLSLSDLDDTLQTPNISLSLRPQRPEYPIGGGSIGGSSSRLARGVSSGSRVASSRLNLNRSFRSTGRILPRDHNINVSNNTSLTSSRTFQRDEIGSNKNSPIPQARAPAVTPGGLSSSFSRNRLQGRSFRSVGRRLDRTTSPDKGSMASESDSF